METEKQKTMGTVCENMRLSIREYIYDITLEFERFLKVLDATKFSNEVKENQLRQVYNLVTNIGFKINNQTLDLRTMLQNYAPDVYDSINWEKLLE